MRRFDWTVLAVVTLGLVLFFSQKAKADWQIVMQENGKWVPWVSPKGYIAARLSTYEACQLDLASARNVTGRLLECRNVKGR